MKMQQTVYFSIQNSLLVFVRYVNIVLVCEHFYHNLWHVTDGLKGLFGFMLATLNSFHRIKTFFQ